MIWLLLRLTPNEVPVTFTWATKPDPLQPNLGFVGSVASYRPTQRTPATILPLGSFAAADPPEPREPPAPTEPPGPPTPLPPVPPPTPVAPPTPVVGEALPPLPVEVPVTVLSPPAPVSGLPVALVVASERQPAKAPAPMSKARTTSTRTAQRNRSGWVSTSTISQSVG